MRWRRHGNTYISSSSTTTLYPWTSTSSTPKHIPFRFLNGAKVKRKRLEFTEYWIQCRLGALCRHTYFETVRLIGFARTCRRWLHPICYREYFRYPQLYNALDYKNRCFHLATVLSFFRFERRFDSNLRNLGGQNSNDFPRHAFTATSEMHIAPLDPRLLLPSLIHSAEPVVFDT